MMVKLGRRVFLAAVVAAAALVGETGAPGLAQPTASKGDSSVPLYKNALKPIDARIEDLLKRMTLEEKTAQLISLW
jgi:beta-glucosidase